MKPESHAWTALYDQAAARLRPGFAHRTLEAARIVAPTLTSQILFSLATAAVCLTVVYVVDVQLTARETARNLAGWEQLAAESEMLGQL